MNVLNRVRETISVGGTGNITLAGAVTNFVSFSSSIALNRYFYYWIVDGANWECGIGHLSAIDTLVRNVIVDGSSGAGVAINASVGADVFSEAPASGEITTMPPISTITTRGVSAANLNSGNVSTYTAVTDRLYLIPVHVAYNGKIGAIRAYINTVATVGSKCRLGIYLMGADSRPGEIIFESADISTLATGGVSATFTAARLPDWVYLAFAADGDPVMRSYASTSMIYSPVGTGNYGVGPFSGVKQTLTSGWTALPTIPSSLSDNQSSIPAIVLEAA